MNKEAKNDSSPISTGSEIQMGEFFVRSLLERNGFSIGTFNEIETVSGGLIHHVYRLTSPDEVLYLKIRGSTFSRLPNIGLNPDDIQYEKKIMDLLEQKLPDMFPHVVSHYETDHALLMTDVMPSGVTLEGLFNAGNVSEEMMLECGKAVTRFQKAVASSSPVRPDNDNLSYSNNLLYRLGYLGIPEVDKAIEQLKQMPRQLIFADFSPKNIGINANNKVTFCDLELVHSGNTIFDVGFLASHILLHSKGAGEGIRRLESFLIGYLSEPNTDLDEELLKVLILGIGLFRLDNPVIPYSLPINENEKKKRITKIRKILSSDIKQWSQIIERMTCYA